MNFSSPVQFPVRILNKTLTGSVVEQIADFKHFTLRIRFSDGFEDIFRLDENGDVNGTTEESIIYGQSVRNDIGVLIGLEPDEQYHVFEEEINGRVTNIWVFERDDVLSQTVYAVYFNNMYRFELRRNGVTWVASTKSRLYPVVEQRIIKKVSSLLDNLAGANLFNFLPVL
jgi:hypothetical protein